MTCRLQRNQRTGRERLQYRCTTGGTVPGMCVNNTIEAGTLDRAVWAWVEQVLRDPDVIAREVRRLSDLTEDPTATRRDLLARQAVEIERQREKLARAVATLADDEASAPLIVHLQQLAAQARAVREEQEALLEERAHWESAQVALNSLAEWCKTVAANLETLTHAERHLALTALNVSVTVWKPGTHDPRWLARMHPLEHTPKQLSSSDLGAASGHAAALASCINGGIQVRMSPGSTQ
jgi:hypothetical protein